VESRELQAERTGQATVVDLADHAGRITVLAGSRYQRASVELGTTDRSGPGADAARRAHLGYQSGNTLELYVPPTEPSRLRDLAAKAWPPAPIEVTVTVPEGSSVRLDGANAAIMTHGRLHEVLAATETTGIDVEHADRAVLTSKTGGVRIGRGGQVYATTTGGDVAVGQVAVAEVRSNRGSATIEDAGRVKLDTHAGDGHVGRVAELEAILTRGSLDATEVGTARIQAGRGAVNLRAVGTADVTAIDVDVTIGQVHTSADISAANGDVTVLGGRGDVAVRTAHNAGISTEGPGEVRLGPVDSAMVTAGDGAVDIEYARVCLVQTRGGSVHVGRSGEVSIRSETGDVDVDDLRGNGSQVRTTRSRINVHVAQGCTVDADSLEGTTAVTTIGENGDKVLLYDRGFVTAAQPATSPDGRGDVRRDHQGRKPSAGRAVDL
jgi:DUF4097 and DUF4098 domain-containing protein YvlB